MGRIYIYIYIYSPQRGGKIINVRENLSSSTLMTAEKLRLTVDDNHSVVGRYKSANVYDHWTGMCGSRPTCNWTELQCLSGELGA
jgi:hypothetical protein